MQNYTQLHSTTSFSPTTLVVEILIKSFAPVCIQWTHPAIERKTSISHAWDDTFTCPANLFILLLWIVYLQFILTFFWELHLQE